MITRVEEFSNLLRKNGLRVSVSEVIDGVDAAVAVGLETSGDLRAALSVTLVKKAGDRAAFDELFSLYFLRGADLARGLVGTPLADLLDSLGFSEDERERLLASLADEVAALSPLARMALGLRNVDVGPMLRQVGAARQDARMFSPLQVGFFTYRALAALDIDGAETELMRFFAGAAQGTGGQILNHLRDASADNLRSIRQAVRRHVEQEFERQNLEFRNEFRQRVLAEKSFFRVSESDLAKLRVEVQKLARKLRTQASKRRKIQRKGKLDLRKTTRRSLMTGGVPMVLCRRKRRVDKPKLVILCDVSDSVRYASRFMLELVYTLQELFDRVRSFVFVSDLGETTDLFRTYDIDRAVTLAYGGDIINVNANSNYGRALEVFGTRFVEAVTSKTTVIVIGDARNNYNPTNASRLAELRRRAKRVLWLNPESPGAWGMGDSVMRAYEPHCDRVFVAQNLASLRRVVDELVL